nr:reverse transcriptase domain-containing protein [Tanacetum cinerariifolium]
MTTSVENRDASKFCEFHGKVGHTTDECMHLKRQIEEMLKAGKLSHLIKELKKSSRKDQEKEAKRGKPQERKNREEDGMESPMIIEAEMGGHFIHCMYVEGGSSSEILYEHCFNRFRPEVRSHMIPVTTPLVGFSREIIWPLRNISLLVKIGDEEHSTSAWMNFMVVRSPSPYNRIIGRPRVRRIQAVPSTAHRSLKFPVAGGTITLRSSRIIPLECIMVSGPGVPQPVINQFTKEKIQVAIHPEYPEQTIAIGSTLTEEGRKELCGMLIHNLDIFVWKPASMTGVLRHIAEDRLNIREGCLPIRQNKRRHAPERNKEIYEEVEKLVDAGIMKKVHYHS